MMQGESIIWFGGSDWWVHGARTEHFVSQHLARQGNMVIYINTIGIGMPDLKRSGTWVRLFRKAKSLYRWISRPEKNLLVSTPIVLPFWSSNIVSGLNRFLLYAQIQLMMRLQGMRDPIVISAIPTAAEILKCLRFKASIYYLKDNFSEYYERMSFSNVRALDAEMRMRSDWVICASKGLYSILISQRDCVTWLPHGINNLYLEYDNNCPEPAWLAGVPHPRITYWGQLESMLSEQLVFDTAVKRPQWHFIFIGPKTVRFDSIEPLENVHFYPAASQQDLIAAGLHSDVLSMPWTETEWIRFSCPIKFREYLAIGKPIVSVPIIEVEEAYDNAAVVARTVDEWVAAIESSMQSNNSEKEQYRKSLVRGCSIEATAKLFEETIEKALMRIQCAE